MNTSAWTWSRYWLPSLWFRLCKDPTLHRGLGILRRIHGSGITYLLRFCSLRIPHYTEVLEEYFSVHVSYLSPAFTGIQFLHDTGPTFQRDQNPYIVNLGQIVPTFSFIHLLHDVRSRFAQRFRNLAVCKLGEVLPAFTLVYFAHTHYSAVCRGPR